ncbi:hypothetical protein BDW02DRAFT_246252 [Decorospora gaudefroyi]|uniref:Uncharacterized protein n=1 Tax=Decorospora gaudefroyi TaxID=184978 RepID=A0A6A5KPM9_9PLEO|nr:hypothetical protein BDW02DRAFT_246252 [Decorospora gaudefroyi]
MSGWRAPNSLVRASEDAGATQRVREVCCCCWRRRSTARGSSRCCCPATRTVEGGAFWYLPPGLPLSNLGQSRPGDKKERPRCTTKPSAQSCAQYPHGYTAHYLYQYMLIHLSILLLLIPIISLPFVFSRYAPRSTAAKSLKKTLRLRASLAEHLHTASRQELTQIGVQSRLAADYLDTTASRIG